MSVFGYAKRIYTVNSVILTILGGAIVIALHKFKGEPIGINWDNAAMLALLLMIGHISVYAAESALDFVERRFFAKR